MSRCLSLASTAKRSLHRGLLSPASTVEDFTTGIECEQGFPGAFAEVCLPVSVKPTHFSYGWGHCCVEGWKHWSFQAYDESDGSWKSLYDHDGPSVHTNLHWHRDCPAEVALVNSKLFPILHEPGVYKRFRLISTPMDTRIPDDVTDDDDDDLPCFHPRCLEIYGCTFGLESHFSADL